MAESAPLVLFLTQTHTLADGRALRFSRALKAGGFEIAAVGYEFFERSPPPGSTIPFEFEGCGAPMGTAMRRLLYGATMLPVQIHKSFAHKVYWWIPEHRRLLDTALSLIGRLGRRPSLIVAKDWATSPIALALADMWHVPVLYDVTEVSYAQFADDWRWRVLVQPFVMEIERRALHRAAAWSAYGADGATALRRLYDAQTEPFVIRNLPHRFEHQPRDPGRELQFLYHGLAAPSRQLETLIDSVRLWQPDRVLKLRLTGKPSYIGHLRQYAAQLVAQRRVSFVDPVPNDKVVAAASESDVGFCLLSDGFDQHLLAEPNKLYQYIAAGLGVIVSDLPTMRQIVTKFGFGEVVKGGAVEDIAIVVNSLTAARVAGLQAAAQAAAAQLCWEREQHLVLEAAEAATRRGWSSCCTQTAA